MHACNTDVAVMRVTAAISMLLMWIKFFYWMRLFRETASFIRMFSCIVKDIGSFVQMMLILILMFANAFLILDQSRRDNHEKDWINEPAYGINILDSVVRTYMIGLGEFPTHNYNKQNRVLVWTLFLTATFLLQIVFMNMLIAIMSDTYSRMQEVIDQSRLFETVQMIADHHWLIDLEETYKESRYVVFVETLSHGNRSTNPVVQ